MQKKMNKEKRIQPNEIKKKTETTTKKIYININNNKKIFEEKKITMFKNKQSEMVQFCLEYVHFTLSIFTY